MNILVTGGAGFIGSHLVKLLIQKGHTVTIVDNLSTGKIENLESIHHAFLRVGDCANPVFLDKVYEDRGPFDFVYHLASTVGVKRVLKDPKGCIENIIDGCRSIIRLGVPGILTSTSEVYGMATNRLREDSNLVFSSRPRWSYATSKLICEWLALSAGWKVVRLFNVVGPRQTGAYGAVLPNFVNQAIHCKSYPIHGDGKQIRTFINVKDCVGILYKLMHKQFDVVNVGGDDIYSMYGLAKLVDSTLGGILLPFDCKVQYVPYDEAYGEGFEDCTARIPDLNKLHSLVGYGDYIPLDETVREIAAYIKQATTESVAV